MSPLEEYTAIIHNRQLNPLSKDEYGEIHHVVPRSCGGGNDKSNLVKLTPEEHYKCHYLLPFIYTEGKEHKSMVYAWWMVAHTRDGADTSEKEYGQLKREFSKMQSERGKNLQFSEEARRKISEAHKGKRFSKEHKLKISKAISFSTPSTLPPI